MDLSWIASGLGFVLAVVLFVGMAFVLPIVLNLRVHHFKAFSSYALMAWIRLLLVVFGGAAAGAALVASYPNLTLGAGIYFGTMLGIAYQVLRDSRADFQALKRSQG